MKKLYTLVCMLLVTNDAYAHGDFKGFSDLQSGMVHPFLDFISTMQLLLTAIFISEQCRAKPGAAYLAFGGGLILTSFLGVNASTTTIGIIASSSLVLVGMIVVFHSILPRPILIVLLAILGSLSFLPFRDDAANLSKLFVVGILLIYCSGFSWLVLISQRLDRFAFFAIGKRVVGSWIVAANILLLVFAIKR